MTRRQLFVFILFVSVFTMSLRPVADPDFWWHLRAGQWMVEHRIVLHQDIFSFTRAGQEWIAHEWLSEWVMYGLYRLGGLPLLILFFAGLITATFALLYLRSEGKPYLAGFALVLGFLATAPVLGVRPQMFTFFLSSLYWYLLDCYRRTGKTRWLVPLPALMLVWVNLHGGYAMGLFLIGVFGLETLAMEWKRRKGLAPESRAQVLSLGMVFLLSFVVVGANPNGWRMYRYPFETLASPSMQMYIQEWLSPDFHAAHWQFLAILLIGLLIVSLFARLRLPLADVILLGFFCYLALRSGRQVQFFVLAAVPVFSASCENLLGARSPSCVSGKTSLAQTVFHGALAALCLLALMARYLDVVREQDINEQERFPARAVKWLESHQPLPNLYNTYDWGGYLIWHLYPEYRVFIDGRADLYGDAFIEEFLSIYRAENDWEAGLARYGVNTVLIQSSAPLAKALQQSDSWVQAYSDEQAMIFLRR